MRILNLAVPENGSIAYKKTQFPDNQQDIRLLIGDGEKIVGPVTIKSRFSSWKDYELIACATAALRKQDVEEIYLFCPYIMGARSDRDFTKGKGGTSYLLDVVRPALELLGFKHIIPMDPHSDVMGAIKGLRPVDNSSLVSWALKDLGLNDICVVSPDAGASKKLFDLLQEGGIRADLIEAGKHRDVATGKFLSFHVPISPKQVDKPLIWIDDICDGGGTFIGEALEADKQGHKGKKYLIVTHGIFSQGFSKLAEHFRGMYCTDSYSSFGFYAGNVMEKTFLKQLEIF